MRCLGVSYTGSIWMEFMTQSCSTGYVKWVNLIKNTATLDCWPM